MLPEGVGSKFTNPATIASVFGYCRVQFIVLLKAGSSDLLHGLSKSCFIDRLLSGVQEVPASSVFVIVLLTATVTN